MQGTSTEIFISYAIFFGALSMCISFLANFHLDALIKKDNEIVPI